VDWQRTAEAGFDLRPAVGVVGVALRQPPHAMQVIGQHHDGQHMERSRRPRRAECVAQQIDVLDEQGAATLQQVNGEEIGAARHPDATVIRHAGSVPEHSRDHRHHRPHTHVGEVRPPQALSRWARAHPTQSIAARRVPVTLQA